jgi:hypothetical protein
VLWCVGLWCACALAAGTIDRTPRGSTPAAPPGDESGDEEGDAGALSRRARLRANARDPALPSARGFEPATGAAVVFAALRGVQGGVRDQSSGVAGEGEPRGVASAARRGTKGDAGALNIF